MTAFTDLVSVEYPIVAFSHCRDVVAAVSRSGGLGVLGAATFTPEQLEAELNWIDDHVGGMPYGVDVLAPPPFAGVPETADPSQYARHIPDGHHEFMRQVVERLDIPQPKTDRIPFPFGEGGLIVTRQGLAERIEVALRHPIRFLVSALGPFGADTVDRAHAAGIVIGGMCGSVKHALAHRTSGVDVVIAQGVEAGGHTGDISTLVLVPQVVDAVHPIPVLAAGGIGTGRQMAAVRALGAAGVWTGSIWLATQESDVSASVQEKLLAAESGDTVRSRSITGKPVRELRTAWHGVWEEPSAPAPLASPLQGLLVKDALAGIYENAVEPLMTSAAGQVVGLMKARRSVNQVVYDLMDEYASTLMALRDDVPEGA